MVKFDGREKGGTRSYVVQGHLKVRLTKNDNYGVTRGSDQVCAGSSGD